jgi:hypothetical protein
MFHDSYVAGMLRFTLSSPEYDGAMHEGILPALRRGALSFSNPGMPPPNDTTTNVLTSDLFLMTIEKSVIK